LLSNSNLYRYNPGGVMTKLEPEVDVGYVENGAAPRDGAAHLIPAAQPTVAR
jgi:hypothetical protein